MKYNIIKTTKYLIIIDDSHIGYNDYTYQESSNLITRYNNSYSKKIIAHLPLNSSSKLEGVDLLPDYEDEADRWISDKYSTESDSMEKAYFKGAEWGYREATKKWCYSRDFVLMMLHKVALRYHKEGCQSGGIAIGGDSLQGVRRELSDMLDGMMGLRIPVAFEKRGKERGVWIGEWIY